MGDREDVRQIVAEAVRETLLQMGLAVHDPIEVQKDMAHLRNLREGSEKLKGTAAKTVIGAVVTAILAAVWTLLQSGAKLPSP